MIFHVSYIIQFDGNVAKLTQVHIRCVFMMIIYSISTINIFSWSRVVVLFSLILVVRVSQGSDFESEAGQLFFSGDKDVTIVLVRWSDD